MKQIELYIHIPFCVKKCAYCDFLSAPASSKERAHYVDVLCKEIKECKDKVKEYEVSTIFFGGGTPSLLTGEQMEQIMTELREKFSICDNAEVTMEMNPGTADMEKMCQYRKSGINRLSIGLQTVHNEELKMLGRIHTYEQFAESYQMARKAGFDNVNIDLISAIPGQTVESWEETLKTIIALCPEHISAYSLIVEPGTPFYDLYGEEHESKTAPKLPDEDAERQMYWLTRELLRDAGYERYEISNYARPGYECRHNLGYWERIPYLGFGLGAASLVPQDLIEENKGYTGTSRYTNPNEMPDYMKNLQGKFCGEMLTKTEEMEEFMFLGLRKMKGVSAEVFRKKFGKTMEDVYGQVLTDMLQKGLMKQKEDRYLLTERGIDISNYVMSEFLL